MENVNDLKNLLTELDNNLVRILKKTKKARNMIANKEGLIFSIIVRFEENHRDTVNNLIEEWAKEKKLNLFIVSSDGYELKECIFGPYNESKYCTPVDWHFKMTEAQLNQFNKENTVLFIKDIDKMENKQYRSALLGLVHEPIVEIEDKKETILLNNILFAIATMGPVSNSELFNIRTREAKDTFMTFEI